jgi:hypothetical protein
VSARELCRQSVSLQPWLIVGQKDSTGLRRSMHFRFAWRVNG